MFYGFMADAVVAFHVVYVSFVVLGQLLIMWGIAARWEWVRNPWFRAAHLAAIVLVALEALSDIACPLTILEHDLRSLAGQEVTEESFVGRLLHSLIYYDFPPWVFNVLHVGFALIVIATFWLAPPRRRCVHADEEVCDYLNSPLN